MSGAEAIAVLGVISSIISIVDGTKQVYDAATNAHGLPKAFREVAARLPIVQTILVLAKRHIEEGDAHYDGAKDIVEGCQQKAKKLEVLFQKVIPTDGASRTERYLSAVRTLGKGGRVETLMKGMLEDVQLLAVNHGMNTVSDTQLKEVADAIREVEALPPSIPEHAIEGTGFTAIHSGSGSINQAQGDQYNNPGSGQIYHAQSMNFGSTVDPKGSEAPACLAALFLTNPRDDREQLIHAKGSRATGTCEWIVSNKLYQSWLHSRSQLLWLSGGPGKGKTMLSIFLAEELERTVKYAQDKLFLQYFCDNKDEKRRTALTIIRGLIFQLLQSRQNLFDHILPSFKIHKESLFTSSSFETLWRIFESMVCDPILGTTYCVLDGLDECDEASLEILLRKFTALVSAKSKEESACSLNLIVVSRELPDFIPELLSGFPRIRLDPDVDSEVNDDIGRFIEDKVNYLSGYRDYPDRLRIRVNEVFQNRAQGTFLWIGIVAKALKKYKASEVEDALVLFPSGLDELYARMLLQIDIDQREVAARILRWVVMAVHPLTLSELSIAIDTTVKPLRPSAIFSCEEVMKDQVSHCGYLLTIKKNKVSLIHQSAKDYLLRRSYDPNPMLEIFRVKERVANLEIARKCMAYLQEGALAAGEVNLKTNTSHLKAFPLLSYAVHHWPEHARSLARSEDIFHLSQPFYHKKSQIRESWLKTYWDVERGYGKIPDSFTLLHLASYFGILPLAENLLKGGFINKVKRSHYLNKLDSFQRTALMWAVRLGHEAVVQLLLEKGARVDGKDEVGWTALHWAADSGHEAVVRLLLEKGAEVDVKDEDGMTPICEAIMHGHEAVVRRLLGKGADIDISIEDGSTALHWAAEGGHEPVVRLLLEKGMYVDVTNMYGATALHRAASNGYVTVVQLLLEKGAAVGFKDERGWTALHEAALHGHEAVGRLLLEKGADVKVKDERGCTALHLASPRGYEAVVRLLLEKGADVENLDISGCTALQRAAWSGEEAIVRLLLEEGADINVRDKDGDTALHEAAMMGREAVVRLLLEKGADINVRDKNGVTALHLAGQRGHSAVVRLLTPLAIFP